MASSKSDNSISYFHNFAESGMFSNPFLSIFDLVSLFDDSFLATVNHIFSLFGKFRNASIKMFLDSSAFSTRDNSIHMSSLRGQCSSALCRIFLHSCNLPSIYSILAAESQTSAFLGLEAKAALCNNRALLMSPNIY